MCFHLGQIKLEKIGLGSEKISQILRKAYIRRAINYLIVSIASCHKLQKQLHPFG